MYTNEFEEAFSNFLERHEYDEAESYLFSMVRLAFAAGWKAAGGGQPARERCAVTESRVRQREEQCAVKGGLRTVTEGNGARLRMEG